MGATVTLSDTQEFCSAFIQWADPTIGNNSEPFLTAANLALQTMAGPPFVWPWNRSTATFQTTQGVQDYSLPISDFGFLEAASLTSPAGPIMPLEIKWDVITDASEQDRPMNICLLYQDVEISSGGPALAVAHTFTQSISVSSTYTINLPFTPAVGDYIAFVIAHDRGAVNTVNDNFSNFYNMQFSYSGNGGSGWITQIQTTGSNLQLTLDLIDGTSHVWVSLVHIVGAGANADATTFQYSSTGGGEGTTIANAITANNLVVSFGATSGQGLVTVADASFAQLATTGLSSGGSAAVASYTTTNTNNVTSTWENAFFNDVTNVGMGMVIVFTPANVLTVRVSSNKSCNSMDIIGVHLRNAQAFGLGYQQVSGNPGTSLGLQAHATGDLEIGMGVINTGFGAIQVDDSATLLATARTVGMSYFTAPNTTSFLTSSWTATGVGIDISAQIADNAVSGSPVILETVTGSTDAATPNGSTQIALAFNEPVQVGDIFYLVTNSYGALSSGSVLTAVDNLSQDWFANWSGEVGAGTHFQEWNMRSSAATTSTELGLTFRLLPVPNTTYTVNLIYQKTPTLFTSSDFDDTTLWGIPDSLSPIYSYFMLFLTLDYFDDPRAARYRQLATGTLLSRQAGLEETDRNLFTGNMLPLLAQEMNKSLSTRQGLQARGI